MYKDNQRKAVKQGMENARGLIVRPKLGDTLTVMPSKRDTQDVIPCDTLHGGGMQIEVLDV